MTKPAKTFDDPKPKHKMRSEEFYQMLVMPVLAVIFGAANLVFFAPPYNDVTWKIARVGFPALMLLIVENLFWYFNNQTLWQTFHNMLTKSDPEVKQ